MDKDEFSAQQLFEAFSSPASIPPQPKGGEPVDDATFAAVSGTLRNALHFVNSGDLVKVAALCTARYLRSWVEEDSGSQFPKSPTRQEISTAKLPTSLPADRQARILSIDNMCLHDDRRVSASVILDGSSSDARDIVRGQFVFIEDQGRYKIDDFFDEDDVGR
ncbi:hypothetical protein [[Micrococcus luteus] ATCC 49442]|uniref:hypothetical protein n=1 Tax=[Micrococcus luteus] ATCC 49442 TaxID=2698727 RepID=UPI0013DAFC07|nr:hypothetical protein [[Micrococcus luteus] ATCC 49442]